jgi:hypothetical protein
MSSATSIKGAVPLKGGAPGTARVQPEAARDDSFRPWHFFVLMSLVAATAAVVLARQSTPENLILLSLTIGAAGLAAAALYRALAPFATADASLIAEPLTQRTREALEREKVLVLRSIKELEFDRAMGKLSPRDFDEMAGRLRARAVSLMKQLDEGGSAYREIIERELRARMAAAGVAAAAAPDVRSHTAGACASCHTVNDADAAFCKRCGARLAHEAR